MLALNIERVRLLSAKKRKNVVAFFDVDGTLIVPQTTNELMRAIVTAYPERAEFYEPVQEAWHAYTSKRTYDYSVVQRAVVTAIPLVFSGLREEDVKTIARDLAPRIIGRTNLFARSVIEHLGAMPEEERGLIVAITGAPQGLVDYALTAFGFHLVCGCRYLTDSEGRYTGQFDLRSIQDKGGIVEEVGRWFGLDLSQSMAFGDSEVDIPMLDRVGFPFAVNPNGELLAHARKNSNIVWVSDRQKTGVQLLRSADGSFQEVSAKSCLPSYLNSFPDLPGMLA